MKNCHQQEQSQNGVIPSKNASQIMQILIKIMSLSPEYLRSVLCHDFPGWYNTKNYGFNYKYLSNRKYIEFRYPGHDIKKEEVLQLLGYFCHITRLAMDKEYLVERI
jgi:hypothetical protein